ncbi:MAG TPA: transglycosylase domain-containing protein [Actinomycetota bacterium]|nr:transglycosylase domain-containing protein [Actinomycetota bacterium]
MPESSVPRRPDPRPISDRVVFKPFALLLLVPVILLASGMFAIVIAPPFVGAAVGIMRIDAKLAALGADFTRIPRFPERSTIYANDGTTELATVYLDNRELIRLEDVSQKARNAVLAIEDAEFYEHGALNWSSLVRAMIENAKAGAVVQGGSTITQQLVGATLGPSQSDQTFESKVQELAIAIRVEEKYTKPEIFELYLNQVYFGNGVYGIGTASEFYFKKPARDLTLAEGATLAGMIKIPEKYDPLDRPKKALIRRNEVLVRMGALGPNSPIGISEEREERAKALPLELPKGVGKLTQKKQPFFVRYMIRQVLENANGQFNALGRSVKARKRTLFEGGLQITTTFDPAWQAFAQQAANQPYAISIPSHGKARPDTSIVTVDTRSGAIRTLLSGKSFMRDELALATDPHPTGSAFKPFVLAAAFEQGIPPTQSYSSSSPFCSPLWNDDDNCVSNAEGSGQGTVDLWTATEDSINVVFAQLILDIGPETVPPVATKMGVSNELPPVASLATGSAEVSPLDMAVGFATLANGGVRCNPYTVETIVRDGDDLYQHEPECERALRPDIAHQITAMLERVPVSGTAAGAFRAGWGPWPVAGKTGTADLNKAVWFCGYTKQLSTAVWVGSNGNPYTLSTSAFGGTVAAPIWRSYMIRAMQGFPAVGFPEPPPPPTGTVPDVVGLARGKAIAQLADAGFNASVVQVDSLEPEGIVAAQSPSGGATVALGTAIRVEVSTGIPPTTEVPGTIGLAEGDARATIEQAGFAVEVAYEEVKGDVKVGTVVRQDPPGGTKVAEGSTVTIVVGEQQPEERRSNARAGSA